MTLISFTDSQQYDFLIQFLKNASDSYRDMKAHPEQLAFEVHHPVLIRLLERVRDNYSVIFPFIPQRNSYHLWMITARTQQQLDQTITHLSRFLVPSYAIFQKDGQSPHRTFTDKNKLQQLGAQLYPAGYYSLSAPTQHFATILSQIDLWLNLEEERPHFREGQQPTYNSLFNTFQTAIAATNWREAELQLYQMEQMHLITADNKAFLYIQLLAQQQRWADIWHDPDFPHLARLRMPKVVRLALLTAFHANILLQLEQQQLWEDALNSFRENRATLGLLLTGRFGLTQEPILRTFAYQATLDEDEDTLIQLYNSATTEETHQCISYLQELVTKKRGKEEKRDIVPSPSVEQDQTALQQACQAMNECNYDHALSFISHISSPTDKALLLLQIAFHNRDVALAEEAILSYWELSQEEQERLATTHMFFSTCLHYLEELTQHPFSELLNESETLHIHTWLDWFQVAEITPEHQMLSSALTTLQTHHDPINWNTDTISILKERLLDFLLSTPSALQHHKKSILHYFMGHFLQDMDFPRQDANYIEIYEILYVALRDDKEINLSTGLALLRLAEALLQHDLLSCEQRYQDLTTWCPKPIPSLENWVLEVIDLFAEYGISPTAMTSWYRIWLETLLNLPKSRERTQLETWRLFGHWIQPGNDILQKLEHALEEVLQEQTQDTIAELPAGYRIGIMTLRASAAQRAKQMLLDRNNALDIRICSEKDLNDQAISIAQNSDMVVVVTTCITHALTYGITPYLRHQPVYPSSSGSSSIIVAIEEAARKWQKL